MKNHLKTQTNEGVVTVYTCPSISCLSEAVLNRLCKKLKKSRSHKDCPLEDYCIGRNRLVLQCTAS